MFADMATTSKRKSKAKVKTKKSATAKAVSKTKVKAKAKAKAKTKTKAKTKAKAKPKAKPKAKSKGGAPMGNANAIGNSGLQKLISSPEEMAERCQLYFDENQGKPFTVVGIALACGMTRQSFLNYCKGAAYIEYHNVANLARAKVEENRVVGALSGTQAAGFAQFLLCNNNDYENMNKIDHTTGGKEIQRRSVDDLFPSADEINNSGK